jgi:hypothetical protein
MSLTLCGHFLVVNERRRRRERNNSLGAVEEFMPSYHPTRDPTLLQRDLDDSTQSSIPQQDGHIAIIDQPSSMSDEMLDLSGDEGGFVESVGRTMEDDRRAGGVGRFEAFVDAFGV